MRNILAKELKIKFVETLSGIDGFSYEDGNPFLIKIYDKPFIINSLHAIQWDQFKWISNPDFIGIRHSFYFLSQSPMP